MTNSWIFCTALSLTLCLTSPFSAAADKASGSGAGPACTQSFETVPVSVRAILNPFYTGAPTAEGLAGASEQLKTLMSHANVCRLMAMSQDNQSSNKQRDIMEWQSLNLWLERLTNFVGLNATGHTHVSWRDEYETFTELYEIDR